MIFALPVAPYAAWQNDNGTRSRVIFPAVILTLALMMIGGYQITTMYLFPKDYSYFMNLNLASRIVTGPNDWLINISRKILLLISGLDYVFSVISGVLIDAAGATSEQFGQSPAVHLIVAYGLMYFGILSLVHCGLPRHFLQRVVPVVGLNAIAYVELASLFRGKVFSKRIATFLLYLIAVVVIFNGGTHCLLYDSTRIFFRKYGCSSERDDSSPRRRRVGYFATW